MAFGAVRQMAVILNILPSLVSYISAIQLPFFQTEQFVLISMLKTMSWFDIYGGTSCMVLKVTL